MTFATVDTGHGANELYPMNQGVTTTSNVTFSTVNTGHGNNNLYPMNQGVRTTDNVQFNNIDIQGDEVVGRDLRVNGSIDVVGLGTRERTVLGTTAGEYIVPEGTYYALATPGTSGGDAIISCRDSTNTARTIIRGTSSILPIGCLVFSDGTNVRINISGTSPSASVIKLEP